MCQAIGGGGKSGGWNRAGHGITTRHIPSMAHGGTIMSFRITGLPAVNFRPLFDLSDEELAARGAQRCIADARKPGYPCRVSLTDAAEGDELLLLNYEHHAVDTPYRMRFAIFVRKSEETFDRVDTVPDQMRSRMLAVRAFDRGAMMLGCDLVDGHELEAAAGCYAARVERA
jgi:hypothetical protein